MQNTPYAVMAQRAVPTSSLDNFPTTPWATRALFEHVMPNASDLRQMVCREPACGQRHMAKVLTEYFGEVVCSDIHAYGYGSVGDYLKGSSQADSVGWAVTNPPFRLGEEFILRLLEVARRRVAMLARTVVLESVDCYRKVFATTPPSRFAHHGAGANREGQAQQKSLDHYRLLQACVGKSGNHTT